MSSRLRWNEKRMNMLYSTLLKDRRLERETKEEKKKINKYKVWMEKHYQLGRNFVLYFYLCWCVYSLVGKPDNEPADGFVDSTLCRRKKK